MSWFLDWLLNRGGPITILAIAGPLIGFYLSQALNRIKILEAVLKPIEQDDRVVTRSYLHAALNKFQLDLLQNLESSYVPRKEYDQRHIVVTEQQSNLARRMDMHDQFHQQEIVRRNKI